MLTPTSPLFTFISPVICKVLPIITVVVKIQEPNRAPSVISNPFRLLFMAITEVDISGAPFASANKVTPVNYSLILNRLASYSIAGVR